MGRKLPWVSSNGSIPTTTRPAKRQKVKAEPAIKPDPNESDSFLNTPHRPKRIRNGRNPSTSPPPELPSIMFMHEGVNGDDAYMMVEDEFQTVAQGFTAHLHMAEYQRLKQEAKMRQNERPIVVPKNASFEVKYKHARKDLELNQESLLKDLTGVVEEQAEEEIVEPWAGTSLAGLMKWDGSQKTSLRGLDKLSSGSRAAQGLGPNSEKGTQSQGTRRPIETDSNLSKGTEQEQSMKDVKREKTPSARRQQIEHKEGVEKKPKQIVSTAKEEDKFPVKPGRQRASLGDHEKTAKRSVSTSHGTNNVTTNSKAAALVPSQKGTRTRFRADKKPLSFLDDLDDFDETQLARSQADGSALEAEKKSHSRSSMVSLIKSENASSGSNLDRKVTEPRIRSDLRSIGNATTEVKPKRDRKARYDEIPVFLY